ncbi:DUF808 domain-containing protein [Falsigemmobacter faecalis]|uniref:DUF808 domain-containing protein n=1 Tax=Falsigemmobacter faecalis TaxID=2488730 RepID=A0A3P3DQJ6_9RHOB|nr:DUF808 domain-containing protein [Falsigemmobacter faecalis]RRH75812.1 DUF808 domain-containing protein [Falsigemmobacter faecalis]
MSGLLALLDDVAAIAKVAAASVDDIAAAAGKAGSKAAGIIIDDAAVTPKYVTGVPASRELPMIWRIAVGSVRNKLVFLLPALMLLSYFFPIAIMVLLLMGGAYLSFEGAEKVLHWILPHQSDAAAAHETKDPERLEEERVAGAIKTDFILSAEIMTISLAQIPEFPIWMEVIALAVVAIAVTAVVYGAVALIVKMDDVGVFIARHGRLAATRGFGRLLVKGMPVVMTTLSIVGTLAMLWVGGSIITHSLHELGWHLPYEGIANFAAGYSAPGSFLHWLIVAALDGVVGLALGLLIIPVVERVLKPLFGRRAH